VRYRYTYRSQFNETGKYSKEARILLQLILSRAYGPAKIHKIVLLGLSFYPFYPTKLFPRIF